MSFRTTWIAALCVVFSCSSLASAATIIDDNFDGYANQAALEAAWTPSGTSGVLTSAQSSSAPNSIRNNLNGTHLNTQTFSGSTATDIVATDSNPLVWSYMFYDDPDNILAEGNGNLGRSYGQLWGRRASDGALNQLLAIGHWNATVPKVSDGSSPTLAESRMYYHARVAFSPGPSWRLMDTGPVRSAGWHEMKAVIGSTTVEMFIDGISVWTQAHSAAEGDTGWYHARIGSGLSSGTAVNFDNYYLAVIPEPSSIALVGLGLVGMITARRRRNR